jgi:predicted TIM-barrel enzyme
MIEFKNKHMIYPVVHVESEEQAIRNTKIAKEAGCDGVFLINHSVTPQELVIIHAAVAKAVPDWWIGINCLGFSHYDVFANATPEMSGIWVDNCGIVETKEGQPREHADMVKKLREKSKWNGIYFGGVAFKYQAPVKDLETACKVAIQYNIEVVTTSGPGTAQAADIDKIERMSNALGEWPLAIASGITADNIEDYLDKATCFLVASGINETWADLDADLVKQLVDKVRSYGTD